MSNFFILAVEVEPVEGGFLATSEAWPDFLVEGETVEEILGEAPTIAQVLLETYQQLGKPLPAKLQAAPEQFTIQILVPA